MTITESSWLPPRTRNEDPSLDKEYCTGSGTVQGSVIISESLACRACVHCATCSYHEMPQSWVLFFLLRLTYEPRAKRAHSFTQVISMTPLMGGDLGGMGGRSPQNLR